MASVITHVAVPLLVGRALKLPDGVSKKRLAVAASLLASLPDLDLATFVFDLRAWDALGHRGFFHSLPFALLMALLVAAVFFRGPHFKPVLGLLFAAAASHGLLDAMTRGDVGIALFSPFVTERFLFPFRPIPVCPLGVTEYFGRWGAIVIGNELMLIVVPLAIATEIVRRVRAGEPFNSLTRATAVWIALAVIVWLRWPYLYAPTGARVVKGYGPPGSEDDLKWVNPAPLPGGALLTTFDSLKPYFGQRLEPERLPWSGGFYPAWFGGEAGRWQEGRLTLALRTLGGFQPMSEAEARALVERDGASRLAPTEKYDLAHADYTFTATRYSLRETHNSRPLPRFWFGLCSGAAASAVERPEPFRPVDVTSPDGHVVRFHPVDVKALLAEAYYWEADTGVLGGNCEVIKFDPGRECSMNPGGLVIGTVNYLARARRSFLLEVYPTRQSQYFAVASARIDLVRAPYPPPPEVPFEPGLKERVVSLADVELVYELSSTMLPELAGDVPAAPDRSRYAKVGLKPVTFRWRAALAIDAAGEIIGGRWTGDPPDGPDNAAFVGGGPLLEDGGTCLSSQPHLEWPFIDALATASTSDEPGIPTLRVDGGR